ncbi:MAG: alpha-hydroxy-acid oxidizing protein, partial [Acetobacteraceae bacterium]|nr:alpha-hydroxy-acid oxidizing protein [Acetobacteraceae bacterium]
MSLSGEEIEGHATSPSGFGAPVATQPRPVGKVPGPMRGFLSLGDFEPRARRRLPRFLFGFIAGGVETDAARLDNLAAFAEYRFVPRVLVDVSKRSQATTLFGKQYSAPFGIAPMGGAALCAYRGDLVLARAAATRNIPMIVSGASLIKLEDLKKEGHTAWFQAYIPGDPARIEPLIDRVAASGYDTLVITADVPVAANRENNARSGYQIPLVITPKLVKDALLHPRWLIGTWYRTLVLHGMPHIEHMEATRGPPVISNKIMRNIASRDRLA